MRTGLVGQAWAAKHQAENKSDEQQVAWRPDDILGPMFLNMKLLAQHTLNGFGGMGEGMSMQLARDGRRILWLAHESAPKNFTAVDVTDPRAPKVIVQTDLPHAQMRSNSLEVAGDLMAVAYQVTKFGLKPAGFDLFDISDAGEAELISHLRRVRPALARLPPAVVRRRQDGAHGLRRPGPQAAQPEGRPGLPHRRRGEPVEAGGGRAAGTCRAPWTATTRRRRSACRRKFDAGFRAHNTNVYPERPDRCYLGYIDGGVMVLDIADRARPKLVSHWTNSPPFNGFTHTVLPLFDRGLLVVSDECVQDNGADWPKLVWVLDARDETNLVHVSTLPGAAGRRLQPTRRPLRRAQPAREPAGAGRLALGGHRARHLLQRRRARLRHERPVLAARDRLLRAACAGDVEDRRRSSSTTCSSTTAASSSPWTASAAASTCSK